MAADAFIAAFTIPNALRRLFGEGALTPAFVSLFTREIQSGETKESWKSFLASSLFWLTSLTSLLSLIGILISPWLVRLYVPEFSDTEGKMALTILLTQILWPFLVFISLAALFMGVLNSFNHFAAPALGPAAMNITVVLLAPLLFALDWDGPNDEYRVHIFAIVTVVSSITQLLIQLPALKRAGALKLPKFKIKDPRVFELFKLLVPSVFGMAIYQINIIINRVFASDIPGAVSHLYYSDLLIELPVSLIATSMSVASVPSFSRLFHAGDREALGDSFRFSISVNLGLAMPAAIGLICLATPLISSVYYSGQFTAEDLKQSSICLIYYAVGLPFFCALRSVLPLFFAAKDTFSPTMAGFIAMAVNFVAAWKLSESFGAPGIALATTISSLVNLMILSIITLRRFPDFPWKTIVSNFFRTLVAALGMGAGLYTLQKVLLNEVWNLEGIRFEKIGPLLLFVSVGAVSYFVLAHLLKIQEMKALTSHLLKRLRRRAS